VSAGAALAPAPPAAPEIRLAGLEKRFGRRPALAGVDLELSGPQIVGVAGPDGAGKTTLLRALAGLLEVEAREARVLGFDLRGDVRALKQRVGYVPQVFALNRDLSVMENLRFTARLHRLPAPLFQRRAAELLGRTALARFADRPAGALSGGMRQKLAVVNALLPEPALLLLDEPTAGVDVVARAEIWEMLAERAASTLILISTSYLDEAEACQRLVYLDAGRVRAAGTPAELQARVPLELYRVWGDDAYGLARAAHALPWVTRARARGRFARVEVPSAGSPGAPAALRGLAALPGAQLVEAVPVDLEAALLALARGSAGEARPSAHAPARHAPMRGPIISARGLTRRFGDFTAVDDLSLSVEAGAIFAFLGANGSGKSTTIRMLIGLLAPTAGEVVVDGIDVVKRPRRVRDHIGYMGQKVSLYQGLTLRENVEFYAGLQGLEGAELGRRWDEVRERFGLREAEGEKPEDLSAGVRQRAGLALATLHEPRLLFLDEPTAGVDVASRDLFWERIREEADAGRTVFVTTHFLEETDYCDRVAFIADGRLVADATPEALRAACSDGYGIDLHQPLGEAARAELGAHGIALEPGAADAPARLRTPRLDGPALGALARALGPAGAGRLRVRQPSMNEVFRRVVLSSARRDGAEAG
jgi:ABC-2 type transport system ATP-binding protein